MLDTNRAEMKNFMDVYPPSKLLDGELGTFAHSNYEDNGMWIRVHLREFSLITVVTVFNRQDISVIRERIVGASVFVKSGDKLVKQCGKFEDEEFKYTFPCFAAGNVIEISQEGNVGEWNLAEIQTWGYSKFLKLRSFLSNLINILVVFNLNRAT